MELKVFEEIPLLLTIIDKAIPYPIIFIICFDNKTYLSVAVKHSHPIKEDNAVIDWTFKTPWFIPEFEKKYQLNLKNNLDVVYKDICLQISELPRLKEHSLTDIVINQQRIVTLKREIEQLKLAIKRGKQFNEKVDLNLRLQEKEGKLKGLL